MAKYEKRGKGNFDLVLKELHDQILNGSISASFEEHSNVYMNNVKVAVRSYEKYSWTGGNRVALTFTLTGFEDNLHITIVSTGGSKGMFFKFNTFGEKNFLNPLIKTVDNLIR